MPKTARQHLFPPIRRLFWKMDGLIKKIARLKRLCWCHFLNLKGECSQNSHLCSDLNFGTLKNLRGQIYTFKPLEFNPALLQNWVEFPQLDKPKMVNYDVHTNDVAI